MSSTRIEKLTPEQEALIPLTVQKWRAIALKKGPIDRHQAKEAVKAAYAVIGKKEPRLIFCNSPYAILDDVIPSQLESQLGSQLRRQLRNKLYSQLGSQLESQLYSRVESQLYNRIYRQIYVLSYRKVHRELYTQIFIQLYTQLGRKLELQENNCIHPELWACYSSWLDFCFSVLNCAHNQRKWQALQSLIKYCGWIYPFEKIAIVCDRPMKLSFDSEERLHAEGEPAIQFTDGYSLYAYHGVTLPEKYGVVYPHQWQAQWLLEESNAALRRVLIQGIGYEQIASQLQATKLDSWQEYTLLRMADVDIEPIYLLKMTCPSTGYIHALRVPPDVKSAREAIGWVNSGTDPAEFSVQT